MDLYDLKDAKEAEEYLHNVEIEYRFQCDGEKDASGCHRLADFLEAFRKNFPEAKKVYQHNCEQNNYGQSCFKMGNYHLLGRSCDKSIPDAMKYYKKGCQNGSGPSCHNVALLHQLDKEFVSAREYLEKGCQLDDVPSCNLLSAYYISGHEGVPRDMKKAFEYGLKSCDMGHIFSCANVGVMYRKGEGVPADEKLADKYKDKSLKMYEDLHRLEDQIKFSE